MKFSLRCLILIALLTPPVLGNAQTKIVVYDGFTGIYNLFIRNDTAQVSTLIKKSPAEKAGIRFRDQIIMINDSLVAGKGLSSREIKNLLNGSTGESISLKIRRKGEESLLSFSFVRDPYLYQISAYEYEYLVDSLEQWDLSNVMEDSINRLFKNPLEAKITVYSVEEGSEAAKNGILAGDQLISLAEEMDKDFYIEIGHGILSTITTDTSVTILRGDSILQLDIEPAVEGDLHGIRSQLDKDFSYPCVWFKFRTENRLSKNRNYLINFAEIESKDSLNLFIGDKTGAIIKKSAGITIPVEDRDFVYKSWRAFSVPLRMGEEQVFYVRWRAEESIGRPLMNVIAQETIVSHDRLERMILSGFFGMIFIISCFFLILFIAIREKPYLYFSLYILSFGIFLFISAGYPGEFSWMENSLLAEFIANYQPFFISVAAMMFLLFGLNYLGLKQRYIWWYRSALIDIGLIGFRLVTILLESVFHFEFPDTLHTIIVISWAMAAGLIPLLIFLLPAIFRIREGFKPAWLFLMANIVLIPLAYITLYSSAFSFTVLTLYESVFIRVLHFSGVHIAAVIQILIFSIGLAQKLRHDDKEKRLAREQMIEQLRENEKLKDMVNRELEQKVQERTKEINEQKEEIESQRDEIEAQRDLVFGQKKEITDSITYAQRIQAAVLPNRAYMDQIISDYFVLFKPRDIVSGDFYWVKNAGNSLIVVVADCTGHGVPGAFMSMLGITLLNEQLGKSQLDQPARILSQLRAKVKEMLAQHGDKWDQKDGMDMAIAMIDRKKKEMQFAGANNPLYLMRKTDKPSSSTLEPYVVSKNEGSILYELKGDMQPIGVYWEESDFTNRTVKLQEQDTIYLFSDGILDQYGGENRKKFKAVNFRKLLFSIQKESMKDQKRLIENAFETWRGHNEQIDDICVVGVRI